MDYYCDVPDSIIENIRSLMISDPGVRSALWEFTDRELFIEAAIEAARSREINVTSVEIESLIREGKKRWLERWI